MKRIYCLFLILLVAALLIGCDSDGNLPIYGKYAMDELIYHSSLDLSSYDQRKEQMKDAQFVIKQKEFKVITSEITYKIKNPSYQTSKMNEELLAAFHVSTSDMLSTDDYKYKFQYDIYDGEKKTDYRLFLMDDELWLASCMTTDEKTEIILNIYRLI